MNLLETKMTSLNLTYPIPTPLKIIVAMDTVNSATEYKNGAPWLKISEELKLFRKLTSLGNNPSVVMDYSEWKSNEYKPLQKRNNYIVSDDSEYHDTTHKNVFYVKNIYEALSMASISGSDQLFVIGGNSVFYEALQYTDEIHLSLILGSYIHDTSFYIPTSNWKIVDSIDYGTFEYQILKQSANISN